MSRWRRVNAAQRAELALGEPVADPVPVQRHPVARADAAGQDRTVQGQPGHLLGGLAQGQQPPVPAQRPVLHRRLIAVDGGHLPPPDPAPVQDHQRVLGLAVVAEQAHPRVHAEDVEAMVRHAAGQHALGEELELAAHPLPEPLRHRVADLGDGNPVEQVVAHPIGLHHPVIQRVGDAAAGRDQLQVRPRAGERLGRAGPAPGRPRRPPRTRGRRRSRPGRSNRGRSAGRRT